MGDLLGSIFGFLGDTVVTALESFVLWLYNLIVVVFQVLWQVIFIIAQFTWKVLSSIGQFFQHLWQNYFKSIFQNTWNAVKSATQWVEAKLQAFLKFLKRLQALQQAYFNTYIRPILVMLQHIRQYLQILSLL